MKTLACGMVLLLVARASGQETLTLSDLVGRPDRWPATVTLARDIELGGGGSASAGQAVKVLEFDGAQVAVDAGKSVYLEVAPGDCDLLAAANAAWAALTPAQRAIEPQTVLADASLWPERVTCSARFSLDDGTELAPGGEYDFLRVDKEGVMLYAKERRTTLIARIEQTDLVKRARERALVEPEKRPSRIAAALKSGLVDASGKPFTSATIDDAKLYLFYYGASWCPPCRKFSPSLVEFARASAKDNPKLAVVMMSNDKENDDLLEYMQDEEMPWPALPLPVLLKTPLLMSYAGSGIPHLVVLDRHGLLLASSVESGRYVGPNRPLQELKKLLEAGRGK